MDDETIMNRIRERYYNGEYWRILGVDPGYKLWLFAVIRRIPPNNAKTSKTKEFNYRKSSGQYHHELGFFERKKRLRKLTDAFNDEMAMNMSQSIECQIQSKIWKFNKIQPKELQPVKFTNTVSRRNHHFTEFSESGLNLICNG